MKLNCGLSWLEKIEAKRKWHRFFALWPRRVAAGDCRWLEYIERRYSTYSFREWEYRAIA